MNHHDMRRIDTCRCGSRRLGSILAGVVFSSAVCPNALAQTVWTLPAALDDDSFHTYNLRTFAEEVSQGSGGALQVNVQTGNEDGSTVRSRDLTRAGELHISELRLSHFAREDGYLGAFNVPFLANNYHKSKRLWEVMRDKVDARMRKRGLEVLFAVPSEPPGIFSDRPLTSTSDMRGMRVGVFRKAGEQLARMIGATPVRVKPSRAKEYLSGGRVNAMFASAQRGSSLNIWEHLSHFYDTKAFLPRHIVVVNRKSFAALPPAARSAVKTASLSAEARGWASSQGQTTAAMAALRGNGMQVQRPGTKLKIQLYKLGKRMTVSWTDVGGLDAIRTIEAFYRVD